MQPITFISIKKTILIFFELLNNDKQNIGRQMPAEEGGEMMGCADIVRCAGNQCHSGQRDS